MGLVFMTAVKVKSRSVKSGSSAEDFHRFLEYCVVKKLDETSKKKEELHYPFFSPVHAKSYFFSQTLVYQTKKVSPLIVSEN